MSGDNLLDLGRSASQEFVGLKVPKNLDRDIPDIGDLIL